MSSESQQWYVLVDGQQTGPFSPEQLAEAVATGAVTAETQVWTEDLAEWIPASGVGGLFPAPTAAVEPAAPVEQPAATVEEYPRVGVTAASFVMIAGFVVGGLLFFVLGWIVGVKLAQRSEVAGQAGILAPVLLGLGALCWLAAGLTQLVYLHRAWKCLAFGNPRTTPGKAVGLMLVPLFNCYWGFVVWHGFARDWNRVTHEFPDLRHAPQMPEGLFLAFCIFGIVFPPAALVLWFPVTGALCKAINFMVFRPVHHTGGFTLT